MDQGNKTRGHSPKLKTQNVVFISIVAPNLHHKRSKLPIKIEPSRTLENSTKREGIRYNDIRSKGFCAASAKRKQQGTKATAAVDDDDASEFVGVWHAPSSLLVEPKYE